MGPALLLNRIDIQNELRLSVQNCKIRGLKQSSKWSAQLVLAIDVKERNIVDSSRLIIASFSQEDDDRIELAKSYFDCGEYRRASEVFTLDNISHSNIAYFLHFYSLYLDGERIKQEKKTSEDGICTKNPHLSLLYSCMKIRYEKDMMDGYELYLFGMVLMAMQRIEPTCNESENPNNSLYGIGDFELNAKSILIKSILQCPYNWSAWLDLATCDCTETELEPVWNMNHTMSDFFQAHVLLETQQNIEAITVRSPVLNAS